MIQNRTTYNVEKYTRYKNILTSCFKTAELDYYSAIFENSRSSTFNLWKSLGPVINPNKVRKQTIINKHLLDGKAVTDNGDISEVMNQYFCEIGSKLKSKIPSKGNDYIKYIPLAVVNSFFLTPLCEEDVTREIKNMNPRKATGHDGISIKILQLCPDMFASNLTKIYNKSLETGEYPSALKVAKVTALFKGSTRYDINNYRPISLLSCFNTMFDKIVCKRLTSFLEVDEILYCYQYGFRKLHSTTLALIEFTDAIRRFLDQGQHVISVFIDLRKAFDTVDHDILLYKLNHYGICGHANNFFKSYLNDRKQFIYINGVKSSLRDVTWEYPKAPYWGRFCF